MKNLGWFLAVLTCAAWCDVTAALALNTRHMAFALTCCHFSDTKINQPIAKQSNFKKKLAQPISKTKPNTPTDNKNLHFSAS